MYEMLKHVNPSVVTSGEWTVDSGEWTVESGQWRVDSGQWTVNSGQWTHRLLKDERSLTRAILERKCF